MESNNTSNQKSQRTLDSQTSNINLYEVVSTSGNLNSYSTSDSSNSYLTSSIETSSSQVSSFTYHTSSISQGSVTIDTSDRSSKSSYASTQSQNSTQSTYSTSLKSYNPSSSTSSIYTETEIPRSSSSTLQEYSSTASSMLINSEINSLLKSLNNTSNILYRTSSVSDSSSLSRQTARSTLHPSSSSRSIIYLPTSSNTFKIFKNTTSALLPDIRSSSSKQTPSAKLSKTSSARSSYSSTGSSKHVTTITTSVTPASQSSSSSSSSSDDYSLSEDKSSLFYIYTQQYDFTDSTTSFTTGLPTTIAVARTAEGDVSSTFSVPQSIITTNAAVYQKWLTGCLDNSSKETSPSSTNKGTIIGSVVGSVGGVIVCALLIWFLVFRRKRNNRRGFEDENIKGFSHEVNNKMGYNTIHQLHKEHTSEINDPEDPFKNEFVFEKRTAPPIPLRRKNVTVDARNIPNINTNNRRSGNFSTLPSSARASNGGFSDMSFFSESSTDSSTFTSLSTVSSIRIDTRPGSLSANTNPQGFFREII